MWRWPASTAALPRGAAAAIASAIAGVELGSSRAGGEKRRHGECAEPAREQPVAAGEDAVGAGIGRGVHHGRASRATAGCSGVSPSPSQRRIGCSMSPQLPLSAISAARASTARRASSAPLIDGVENADAQHAVGMLQRQPEAHEAAHRMAHHIGPGDAKCIEQCLRPAPRNPRGLLRAGAGFRRGPACRAR